MPKMPPDFTIHMWIMGALFTLFSGAALTNAYWLNRSVNELQKDVGLLKFKVFNVISENQNPVIKTPRTFLAYPSLFSQPLPERKPRGE